VFSGASRPHCRPRDRAPQRTGAIAAAARQSKSAESHNRVGLGLGLSSVIQALHLSSMDKKSALGTRANTATVRRFFGFHRSRALELRGTTRGSLTQLRRGPCQGPALPSAIASTLPSVAPCFLPRLMLGFCRLPSCCAELRDARRAMPLFDLPPLTAIETSSGHEHLHARFAIAPPTGNLPPPSGFRISPACVILAGPWPRPSPNRHPLGRISSKNKSV